MTKGALLTAAEAQMGSDHGGSLMRDGWGMGSWWGLGVAVVILLIFVVRLSRGRRS